MKSPTPLWLLSFTRYTEKKKEKERNEEKENVKEKARNNGMRINIIDRESIKIKTQH